jgi:hypothetical protein
MSKLAQFAHLSFPGAAPASAPKDSNLHFAFVFEMNAKLADAHVQVTGQAGASNTDPASKQITLIFEPIFGHEFGHIFGVQHHYDELPEPNNPLFMPPDENICVMARNGMNYCSACRAAMHLNPVVDNTSDLIKIADDINKRYPASYGKV